MNIINWLTGQPPEDPVIKDLEVQLKEAQDMVEWHTRKLAHHQALVERYSELINKVKKV